MSGGEFTNSNVNGRDRGSGRDDRRDNGNCNGRDNLMNNGSGNGNRDNFQEEDDVHYFHVYGRGINGMDIFHCDADKRRFLFFVQLFATMFGIKVYAFALMTNHFHILVSGEQHAVVCFMKYLHNAYSGYYCSKYKYRDKVIYFPINMSRKNNASMLIATFLYILNNPVDARLCKTATGYKWNSYLFYTGQRFELRNLITIDTSIVKKYFRSLDDLQKALRIKLLDMKSSKRFKYK